MSTRIGQFLLFVGLLFCLLFYASYAGKQTNENFLGWALIFLVGGGFLVFRNRKPPANVERFRYVRTYNQRQEQRRKTREEKLKAKEAERLAKKKHKK
jgi:hypothetical protein